MIRPLLTAAEVVAAIANGDVIECENDGSGWMPSGVAEDSDIAWLFSLGMRYRARPAGESHPDPRDAEIEALRAENDRWHQRVNNVCAELAAAEARAASLQAERDAAQAWQRSLNNQLDTQIACTDVVMAENVKLREVLKLVNKRATFRDHFPSLSDLIVAALAPNAARSAADGGGE